VRSEHLDSISGKLNDEIVFRVAPEKSLRAAEENPHRYYCQMKRA
jgi:hypothetical protein